MSVPSADDAPMHDMKPSPALALAIRNAELRRLLLLQRDAYRRLGVQK